VVPGEHAAETRCSHHRAGEVGGRAWLVVEGSGVHPGEGVQVSCADRLDHHTGRQVVRQGSGAELKRHDALGEQLPAVRPRGALGDADAPRDAPRAEPAPDHVQVDRGDVGSGEDVGVVPLRARQAAGHQHDAG
jgi:hypothetical protein